MNCTWKVGLGVENLLSIFIQGITENLLQILSTYYRSTLIHVLQKANARGWRLAASADVSADYIHQKNRGYYPCDVHSWYFVYRPEEPGRVNDKGFKKREVSVLTDSFSLGELCICIKWSKNLHIHPEFVVMVKCGCELGSQLLISLHPTTVEVVLNFQPIGICPMILCLHTLCPWR